MGVLAGAGVGIALALLLILREIRALRFAKIRKPLADFLAQGAQAYTARLKDHAMSDEVLQGLHAVAAFAQHGVKEYDKSLKVAAASGSMQGTPGPSAPAPSVMDSMMSEPPIRIAGPPPDGTSSPA